VAWGKKTGWRLTVPSKEDSGAKGPHRRKLVQKNVPFLLDEKVPRTSRGKDPLWQGVQGIWKRSQGNPLGLQGATIHVKKKSGVSSQDHG